MGTGQRAATMCRVKLNMVPACLDSGHLRGVANSGKTVMGVSATRAVSAGRWDPGGRAARGTCNVPLLWRWITLLQLHHITTGNTKCQSPPKTPSS